MGEREVLLKSGHNQRKLGKKVVKGKWTGMPIFSLTLEERATCPRSCGEWRNCYGNRMPYSKRYQASDQLEERLYDEVRELAHRYPRGFVVRLHVLGDFYSEQYVRAWHAMMRWHPELHVFGYTAHRPSTVIGEMIDGLNYKFDRWVVRFSGVDAVTIAGPLEKPAGAIICPAQTGQSLCCGTCTLCWAAPDKTIAFLVH